MDDRNQDKMDAPGVMRVLVTPDSVGGRSLFERFMQLPRNQRFMIGDGVDTKLIATHGQIRGIFLTISGKVMYIVEDGDGQCLARRPDQLRLAP